MGFDCKLCGEREIWAFESDLPRICEDCYKELIECREIFKKIMFIYYFCTGSLKID